ncbi:PREDICTED: uncharacterized protein LOC104708145 [Camelina sativa]|uniref:Uncharacterized protein LOC104708145 n=1 Tax=Camelina sativa TaxID=90675 RepID=A0ABM0T9M0_CAMSA|nr:PREDICTED: uncharacterized protein LOC104708145 [Camelina sativa]
MRHPYHPQHPLMGGYRFHSDDDSDDDSDEDNSFARSGVIPPCTWCGEELFEETSHYGSYYYQCSLCNFGLCTPCVKNFPLPTISNPKSHHHSLTFLPRPLLVPCDACGLVERSDPSYVCFQCNYVVHKSCINLPRVIKLTRHSHRLSYTPFLPPKIIYSCRLCYKTIDNKYGQYSCNDDFCSYVVHSKCATHQTIWDGRELEWEPEELDETEDVAPFKIVGDDLIKYFCHEHNLKLEKYNGVRDKDKQCQACILHIDSRNFYNCTQCDFFLHEVCANLPRKLDHALHQHPLFLDPVPPKKSNFLTCVVCSRAFAGFSYKCACKGSCRRFQVDVRCILVAADHPFTHKSHERPLFIPISTVDKKALCGACKTTGADFYLQCTLCDFSLCYKCATVPDKLHYKYDALPLSLCYGEASNETYWCEVCEGKLDPSKWFYTCNKSYINIHLNCVFGSAAYMKSGYTFYNYHVTVKVLYNNCNTRPICRRCDGRCSSYVFLKLSDGTNFCSNDCLGLFIR